MHKEALDEQQISLFSLLKLFKENFGLVGGTAMALHMGHRRSIDFDLFSNSEFDNFDIRNKISHDYEIKHVFKDVKDEYTVIVDNVKCTFLYYPFEIDFTVDFEKVVLMPDLITLAAMKAYTLGRRAKWKDYVDLFFITRDYHSMEEIVKKALTIFGSEFNEKIFKSQLSYFDDIDYSEEIIYMKGCEVGDEEIREALVKISV